MSEEYKQGITHIFAALVDAYPIGYTTSVIAWIDKEPNLKEDRMKLIRQHIEYGTKSKAPVTKAALEAMMAETVKPATDKGEEGRPSYVPSTWRKEIGFRPHIEDMWKKHCTLEGVGMSAFCEKCVRQSAFCECAHARFLETITWAQFEKYARETHCMALL